MPCKLLPRAFTSNDTLRDLLWGQSLTSSCAYRKAKDLKDLASLGHFLKGSSATLGLTKVKESCEKIQHYGNSKDEDGTTDQPDEEKCLERIKDTLKTVKEEYAEAEKVLRRFYS